MVLVPGVLQQQAINNSINALATYDIDFTTGTVKGGNVTLNTNGNAAPATDLFRYGAVRYTSSYVENADGSVSSRVATCMRSNNRGLWVEQDRINRCLYNRDLTNAAWVKSNVTASKNQTGVDGSSNAASSITATAGNGTVLQSITAASAARISSAFVKRISGSGTLEMTQNNGGTWTPVTVTASWTRVEIPYATLTNPVVGFRIGTSGDSFAIDFVQLEGGNTISGPLATTSSTFQSWGDRATADDSGGSYLSPLAAVFRGGHGFFMELCSARIEQSGPLVSSAGPQCRINTDGSVSYIDNASHSVQTAAGQFTRGRFTVNRIAGYIHSTGDIAICCNGNSPVAATTGTLSPSMSHIDLATNGSLGLSIHGLVRRVAIFDNGVLTPALLQQFTAL